MSRSQHAILGLAAAALTIGASGPASAFPDGRAYILVIDQKDPGERGGECTPLTFVRRDLNLEVEDDNDKVVVIANQMLLSPGVYEASIRAPALAVGRHRARLVDSFTGEVILDGAQSFTDQSSFVQTDSVITGRFTIDDLTTLEVQHYCTSNPGDFAFGAEADDGDGGVGIFTTVQLYRFRPPAAAYPPWALVITAALLLGAAIRWMPLPRGRAN